jgi:hypothetical protein
MEGTVDEKEVPRDDGRLNLHDESGMTRRDLMRRGAVVGGTLLWVAPAIQSIGSKAYAQTGTPLCAACLSATFDPPGPRPPITEHVIFTPTPGCCECIEREGGGLGAVVECALAEECTGVTIDEGPCP